MNETQQRIKAYQDALPGLRERVAAVALLLVMSVVMMTSASFAWLTISRAPAVTGVNTNVAANGSLEIALVNSSGSQPGESQVGDSSAAEGQSVTAANLTWGNLINLSDSAYGLENLSLRPAQLNRSALLTSPLYGAVYSIDGRIEKLSSSFGFAVWDEEAERFMIKNEPGVRAISSVTVEAVGFAQKVYDKRTAAEGANLMAGSAYLGITGNKDWMGSLATIMGIYMTAKMNAGQGDESLTNPTMEQEDVQNLESVFEAFVSVYKQQANAMVEMLNYQLFLMNNSEAGSTPYTEYTYDTLMETTEAALKAKGLQITGLDQLKKDFVKLEDGWAKLQVLSQQGTVKWLDSGIDAIVNSLMDVGKCTLDGTPVNNIGVSNATGYLDGKTHNAVITNGILYNFEKMNGANCKVEGLTVSAKVKRMGMTIPASISANITTNAPAPSSNATDLEFSDSLNQGAKGVEVAQDTYGLAVDLWVRTNAQNSYLTLEGNVLTETETVYPTGKDSTGNTVDLYTLTLEQTDEETQETVSYTIDVYKTTAEDGTETWHNAASHAAITLSEGQTPTRKVEEVEMVIGFEGENRIWNEDSGKLLSTSATTQGSGSCYVYYADTPEDQARSLELLKAFNVAFVSADGRLLATAGMDTERFYADNGRVIVPLVLNSDSIDLGEDAQGNVTYAITALEKNTPTRITALVYLDGTKLTNDQVLAAADIQGQLNIQFGSSESLIPVSNEKLENATLSVSASLDKTQFDYDTATGPMTTRVTLNVDADEQPNTVTAFFLRSINSSQGSREQTMTFTNTDGGTWVADYTFTVPGNYVLRAVQLDGQEYVLSNETIPTVNITGFAVESLSCTQAENKHISIMTAANSYSVDLQLKFATDDAAKLPRTVQGRFLNDEDGSAVNVNFTLNPTTQQWTGKATFLSSGNYTMQYLVLDGEYNELDSGLWQTASVFLGMKVAVYTDSPTSFLYLPSELADNQLNLYMKVKVMDNTGEAMEAISGLTLYYSMQGSALAEKGMSAPLTWDADSGYYTCTFPSKIGMYNFSQVTVGGNTITNATTAPAFRIISPEPPVFNSGQSVAYQYCPANGTTATLKVLIDNCEAATVYADIKRVKTGTTTEYEVEGNLDDNGNWVFTLPRDANGTQDGEWEIAQLRLWDVYAKDGTAYTETSPLVFDMAGETGVSAKVVSTINATFREDKSQNFTGNGFMVPYTVSGLYVDIKDYEGASVADLLSSVTLTFEYVTGSSQEYGGYSSSDLTNTTEGATVTVTLTDDGSGTRFVQTGDVELLYAGKYNTTLAITGVSGTNIGVTHKNTDKEVLTNLPVFTVSTESPTVKITSVSTNASTDRYYLSSTPSSLNVITGSYNWKADDGYSAAVYMYVVAKTGTLDQEQVQIKYPTVTLSLSGVPATHSGATMVFPSGNNTSSTFSFAAGGTTAKTTIGAGVDGVFDEGLLGLGAGVDSWPVFYPAGKQTVDEITVTYNGIDFAVDLTHAVTINNPQTPPTLNYKVNDSTFTQTLPGTVYSQDGETITVTLPSYSTWTEDKSSTTNGDFVVQSGYPSTRQVYRTWTTGTCNKTTYYEGYTETTTVSKATSSTSTWVNTHAITGWKVGSTTYAPGETVTVTGSQTITAVVTVTEGAKTVTATTTTRTEITYTNATGSQTTNPGGTNIGTGSTAPQDSVTETTS